MDPLEAFDTINRELAAHARSLAERPQLVVLNKVDLLDDPDELDLWAEAFEERGVSVMGSSGLTGEGTQDVLRAALRHILDNRPPEEDSEPWSPV